MGKVDDMAVEMVAVPVTDKKPQRLVTVGIAAHDALFILIIIKYEYFRRCLYSEPAVSQIGYLYTHRTASSNGYVLNSPLMYASYSRRRSQRR